MRPVSPKMAKLNAQAKKVAEEVRFRDGGCVVHNRGLESETGLECSSPFHTRPQIEVHEIVTRARWRQGVLDPENRVCLCQTHHDWVTEHPERARPMGLYASAPPL